jgi:hypothetical protein
MQTMTMYTVVDEHGVVEATFANLDTALEYQEVAGEDGESVYVVDDSGQEH